jgi:hypothetical protein
MFKSIQDLIEKNSWKLVSNYSGPNYSDWVQGLATSRDSDVLSQSNFSVLLELLGGELEGQVQVVRFGHWGCGWVEQIQVHHTATDKLAILMKALNDYEEYPVLDEHDLHECEAEYAYEQLKMYGGEFAEELAKFLGLKNLKQFSRKEQRRVIRDCFHEEAGYGGLEEAYLNVQDYERIARHSSYLFEHSAKEGNKLAQLMLDKSNELKKVVKLRA